ncbi:MAG: hypothetical protein N3E37_00900 [Candidatus Micrarchaeota archaeon]|nr:hypothetical protein [Candidatus Micrarchaeota archaeon]
MKKFIILLYSIIQVSLMFAQNSYLSASGIGLLGIFTSIFIIAIIFMAAKLSGNVKLEIFAKEEGKSTIITFLIIVIFTLSASFFNEITKAFLGSLLSNSNYAYESIDGYAYGFLQQDLKQLLILANKVYTLIQKIAVESSKSVYCGFLGVGYTINVCAVVSVPIASLNILHSTLVASVSLFSTLLSVLEFFRRNGLLFLFLGVIARAFSYTRGTGNALIAIFIAFTFVMPLVIIGYRTIYQEIKFFVVNSNYPNQEGGMTNLMKEKSGYSNIDYSYILSLNEFDSLRSYSCDPQDSSLVSKVNYIKQLYNLKVFEPILFDVYFFYMLMPAFVFLVTFGVIHSLSRMMGVDIEVFRLERIQ